MDAAFGCSLGIPFGAFGTSGIPCRLAATGDYPPSLRSPWRAAEVEWAWKAVDPVIRHWQQDPNPVPTYPAGTWGPAESRRLFEKPEQHWRHSLDPE
ncbi:MAG: hypothetical protein DSZ00_04145 [Gammaproteobacteria bacterium]|nr:MAG: hypothetical protein DSZ00_04145 [Gammaproteobacteria bacterium]RTZ81045.1 MAG: hypothetical protein DSZ01_01320 [Gammaproteobacteria bacterium]